jgi:hypothetical protein
MTKSPSIPTSSDLSTLFQKQILQSLTSSETLYSSFSEGIYLRSPEALTNTNHSTLTRYKIDPAYYEALTAIDWNVFVTLKFRAKGYKSLPAQGERERYVRELGQRVVTDLGLSSNDLQYFWSQEVNSENEAHLHVLFYRVYPEKCSVEQLRCSIERNISPAIVQVPPPNPYGEEPPHVQTVRSPDNVVRYVLKMPLFGKGSKTVGTSRQFTRFWKRHMKWKARSTDRTATPIPAVGSKGTYPNTILSAYP